MDNGDDLSGTWRRRGVIGVCSLRGETFRSAVCSHEPAALHHYIICPVERMWTKRGSSPASAPTVEPIVQQSLSTDAAELCHSFIAAQGFLQTTPRLVRKL